MSELLGLSFDAPASPEISFFAADLDGVAHGSGWGVAWYPAGELAALSLRDPYVNEAASLASALHDWDRFRTVMVLAHLRGAAKRRAHRDTQPFLRILGGRTWTLAHNGDLTGDYHDGLALPPGPQFAATGSTDTEHLFSWLLANAAQQNASCLAELGYDALHALLRRANRFGTMNLLIGDGTDLIAYQDAGGVNPMWWNRSTPPRSSTPLTAAGIKITNSGWTDAYRTMVVVSNVAFGVEGWTELHPGQMLVVRRGSVIWSRRLPLDAPLERPARAATTPAAPSMPAPAGMSAGTSAGLSTEMASGLAGVAAVPGSPSAAEIPAGGRAPSASDSPAAPGRGTAPAPMGNGASGGGQGPARRLLDVVHQTVYTYDQPVERSSHSLRLSPVVDGFQRVVRHSLDIGAAGSRFRFEDVFGNTVTGFEVTEPFGRLTITARSTVEVVELVDRVHLLPNSQTLPLVWMPWQRQMMHAYLMPPELPESQLQELVVYAQSFAERNGQDLLAAIDDLNLTIHRDFVYLPGYTTLETTPFEVYVNRAGVCQDFANLMICLARLLGIPARYRVGYIFTGTDYTNTIQSEASHAWVELYLPQLGWRGYDPTNGTRAGRDHIRVACGRNYRDATPTAGVIHRGGGGEVLVTTVRVEERLLTTP